jgi:predicted transcriptional regulator
VWQHQEVQEVPSRRRRRSRLRRSVEQVRKSIAYRFDTDLRRSIAQADAGELIDADEVLAELQRR